jgi:hypothetical protein
MLSDANEKNNFTLKNTCKIERYVFYIKQFYSRTLIPGVGPVRRTSVRRDTMLRRFVVVMALAAMASAAVPSNQIVALNELYSNTSGKWWGNSANPAVHEIPCANAWHGISCTAGFVYVCAGAGRDDAVRSFYPPTTRARCCSVGLALPDNNLSGTLPESLGALTDLA